MKIDISFLVIAYIVGLFVDYIFQWSWEASNKGKWGKNDNKLLSLAAITSHSFVYALLTTLITLLLIGKMSQVFLVFFVLFITHAAIDTRIPIKYIMRFKGMSWEQIYDKNYSYLHMGIDQRLHDIVILILALII